LICTGLLILDQIKLAKQRHHNTLVLSLEFQQQFLQDDLNIKLSQFKVLQDLQLDLQLLKVPLSELKPSSKQW